jgi:hypothetical protein
MARILRNALRIWIKFSRCQEMHLVLNWEKCHFMVREWIVLGRRVPERGIEVDWTKIE